MQLIESVKSFFGVPAEVKSLQSTTTMQMYNQIFPSWLSYKYIAAFHAIDIVNAVVNKIAKTAAALPIYGYNQVMEDLPETDKLTIFLRSFTYVQRLEMYTWLVLADEVFVYEEKTLGVNGTVNAIYFLNPSFVTVVVTDSFPQQIAYYIYRDPNRVGESGVRIELDEMVFIRGFNPTTDPYLKWRGLSKVDVLRHKLTRLESNVKNSVAQLQNGGVPGVLFQKDLAPQSAKAVIDGRKENFARFMQNSDNKGAPFFAAGEMGYFAIGSNMVDMDSIALEKVDNKAVCSVWGISDTLLNSDSAATESNVKEMIRQMYTNAVKPYTTMVDDALNKDFVIDFGPGFRQVHTDYSDVHELQSSLKEKVDAMAAAPVMIPNDVLEAMGYDRVDNDLMDLPLIKSGYAPIDNFEPLPPIE